ncbi:MAG: diguanylate cyclase [Spirochaetales bacterium]|nr:diguanylate cyclase [Spirochaetales bacterium]
MQKKFNLIILLLLLSIFFFIFYNVNELVRKTGENEYNRLINNLNKDTTDFTSWISNKKQILNTAKDFVDNFTYEQIIEWNTLNPYLNINNDDPDISQIYIGLADGGFITGGRWVPPEDYDPRTRVWYKEALEADHTIISDVYIDRETGDRTVTISSPLYLHETFIGIISADVFMNDISEWLRNKMSGEDVYTYLIDPEGTVIVHTLRPELVGTNLYRDSRLYDSFFLRMEGFLEYFEEVKNTSQVVKMEYTAAGKKTRGIIRKVEDGDWYLSVAAIEEKNLVNFIRLNGKSILFNLLILSVIITLLHLVMRIKIELEHKNKLLTIDNESDFLTGIYNRRYFNLYIEQLWENGAEDNSEVSLLMMDIDHFKGYNDTYGHIKGDEVLIEVTDIINHTIRKQDVFSRYGGEEFVLVLNQVTPDDVQKIASKIVEAVYERNIVNSSSPLGRITISIGIASMKGEEKIGVRQFIHKADQALYSAKEEGRNRFSVYASKN